MGSVLLAACAALFVPHPRPAGLAPDLAPPVQLVAGGKPIDVERHGEAAPFVGDFFGDGKPALMVGEHYAGRMRVYRNLGTAKEPKYGECEFFQASEGLGTIKAG